MNANENDYGKKASVRIKYLLSRKGEHTYG